MDRTQIVPIAIIATVVSIAVAAGIYFVANPDVWNQVVEQAAPAQPEGDGLTASGFVEAEQVVIAPELGGRVVKLLVHEGEEVVAGQELASLDGTLMDAQIEVAQADLGVAEAQLAKILAGARPEQVRQAEAAVTQVEAARDGAYQAWQDLIALRDSPQRLDARIMLARARAAAAEAALVQATAIKDAAEISHDNYWKAKRQLADVPQAYRPGLQMDFHLIPNAYWKAWVGVNTAQAALDGAGAALANLYAMRSTPQELNARIDAARAEHRASLAGVDVARAQLDALRGGATEEEIAIVEAHVEQARAALGAPLVLRSKQTIVAPVGGIVLAISTREGELAVPGGALLTLGDLDQVTLTVYVREDRVGKVQIGLPVAVSVDSFPGRTFDGTVVAIADEAEFTPRNVQTQAERVNMLFAVDVRIPNPDHALKPGVPAGATLR